MTEAALGSAIRWWKRGGRGGTVERGRERAVSWPCRGVGDDARCLCMTTQQTVSCLQRHHPSGRRRPEGQGHDGRTTRKQGGGALPLHPPLLASPRSPAASSVATWLPRAGAASRLWQLVAGSSSGKAARVACRKRRKAQQHACRARAASGAGEVVDVNAKLGGACLAPSSQRETTQRRRAARITAGEHGSNVLWCDERSFSSVSHRDPGIEEKRGAPQPPQAPNDIYERPRPRPRPRPLPLPLPRAPPAAQ